MKCQASAFGMFNRLMVLGGWSELRTSFVDSTHHAQFFLLLLNMRVRAQWT